MRARIAKWLYVSALLVDPRLVPEDFRLAEEVERIWGRAVSELVSEDLHDGFRDGDDIVIRYRGNKADWTRLRALVHEYERRQSPERETS